MKNYQSKKIRAFSLIELLIVVAIISLLTLALIASLKNERQKAEDVRVKTDLERLKIAFEDYHNDNNCYPPADWFDSADDCNSNKLQPYLAALPCDPRTKMPYKLESVDGQCNGFRLYATIQNIEDPAVKALCTGSGGSKLGNYGVSSTNTTVAIDCTLAPSPSPSPSAPPAGSPSPSIPLTSPGPYACQYSICNNFGYPNQCAVSFSNESICETYCSTPGAVSCNPI